MIAAATFGVVGILMGLSWFFDPARRHGEPPEHM